MKSSAFSSHVFPSLLIFLSLCINCLAQSRSKIIVVDTALFHLTEISSLPQQIKEASGLEITRGQYLWTHNDDRLPILYCLDTTGQLVKTLQLNHPNSGWEDLTKDDRGNMYVGAFGNNKNDKRSLKIYKVQNPDAVTTSVYNASVIQYNYGDQKRFPPPDSRKNFDVDAFLSKGDSLYLFTKNRTSPFTGYTKIYRLPQEPGDYTIMPVDSIYLGNGPMMDTWVTGAALSPDGKTVALLSHQCLWLITDFLGNQFSTGKIYRLNLNHFSHKTGVCYASDTKIYIVDERELGFLGGKLYTLDISGFQHLIANPQ